jgi:hypothetical protein
LAKFSEENKANADISSEISNIFSIKNEEPKTTKKAKLN